MEKRTKEYSKSLQKTIPLPTAVGRGIVDKYGEVGSLEKEERKRKRKRERERGGVRGGVRGGKISIFGLLCIG